MDTLLEISSTLIEVGSELKDATINFISNYAYLLDKYPNYFTLSKIDYAVRNGDLATFQTLKALGHYPTVASVMIATEKNYTQILKELEED